LKKTKRKNPQQLKAEQAHQKNLYLKRIKEMMTILGCADAYDMLGKDGIDFFDRFHLRPLKFINPNSGMKLPNNDLKILNEHFSHLLKEYHVLVGPEKKSASYYDFYTLIETIHFFWRNCHEIEIQNSSNFKERFKIFKEGFNDVREKVHQSIDDLIYSLMWAMSDFRHSMVWIEYQTPKKCVNRYDISFVYNNYIVHIEKPESKVIEIDHLKRNVFRVGMIDPKTGINWMDIKPEELGITGVLCQLPLKIYIQPHALDRIKERTGNFIRDLENTLILTSLLEKIISPSHKGGFLFAVRYLKLKLGYLKADVVGDILVIRTFLFLTNNGTPEGNKLEELLGLQKEDKKYLGIDKLDTFIRSDIDQNNELKKIFIKAGCGDLFKLKEHAPDIADTKLHCSQYILQYLGLDKKEQVCLI